VSQQGVGPVPLEQEPQICEKIELSTRDNHLKHMDTVGYLRFSGAATLPGAKRFFFFRNFSSSLDPDGWLVRIGFRHLIAENTDVQWLQNKSRINILKQKPFACW